MTETLGKTSAEDRFVQEWLAEQSQQMIDKACAWSNINTGSWNRDGLESLAPLICDALDATGGEIVAEDSDPFEIVGDVGSAEIYDTGPVLRCKIRPEAPVKVVMSGHYDTVFPPKTFEGITFLDENRLNGPGLADMKGGLVVMLNAICAFNQTENAHNVGFEIVITPDEEIGNFASSRALTEAARSGAHLGMTYEPCMESGAMSGGRKGSAVFDMVIRGRSAHAGRAKADGRSAIEAAALAVTRLEGMNSAREGVSVNVGKIDGGSAVNIVPDLAIVRFGARAPDAEAAEWTTLQVQSIVSELRTRPGIEAHLHGGFYRPPKPRNEAQQALFDAVRATGLAIGLDLTFEDTGGVCEGNNIFAAGVPNVDTLGVMGGRIHSSEEYVVLSSFVERSTLSAMLLNRLADGRLDAKRIKALMG